MSHPILRAQDIVVYHAHESLDSSNEKLVAVTEEKILFCPRDHKWAASWSRKRWQAHKSRGPLDLRVKALIFTTQLPGPLCPLVRPFTFSFPTRRLPFNSMKTQLCSFVGAHVQGSNQSQGLKLEITKYIKRDQFLVLLFASSCNIRAVFDFF